MNTAMLKCSLTLLLVLEYGAASSIPDAVGLSSDATAPEITAAHEIVDSLNKISGSTLYKLVQLPYSGHVIAVGYTGATMLGVANATLDALGLEGFLATSSSTYPGSFAIAGSKQGTRGTLYGANYFLEAIGVKFVAMNVTIYPQAIPSSLSLDHTFTPGLEYREQYSYDCLAGGSDYSLFNVHRRLNKGSSSLNTSTGGSIIYATPPGFVHTSYAILGATNNRPPPDLYNEHREWFWPRNDSNVYGQLCWSNTSLQAYIVSQVKAILHQQPDATIISVSQNDNYNYCQSPEELAIIKEEGTPGGALFRAVNVVADGIKDEFPNVAIDTLAYQWSRPAPKITVPRSNVIIRLCSIECNFGAPLTDPSNVAFQTDIVNWGKISKRTYIWNYITNFHSYLSPFPDWYSLGPNVQFYVKNGVQGIFQEGSYTGPGGDMAELKSYVLSNMMYDPTLDSDKLIGDFLDLYYGPQATPFIKSYLDGMHNSVSATKYYMHESFDPSSAPFMTPDVVLASATAFKNAIDVTAGQDKYAIHVRCSSMAIYYVVLLRWAELIEYAKQHSIAWPLESTLEEGFNTFATAFNLTTMRYGVAPSFSEGGGPGNLTAFHQQIFPTCSPGWVNGGSGICTPSCPDSSASQIVVPSNVSASSYYRTPPTVYGGWGASSYPPQWIEFEFSPEAKIIGVSAVVEMVPNGNASHTLSVGGANITTWSGSMQAGQVLDFVLHESMDIFKFRITTTLSPSWVAWRSITFFSCG